MPAKKAPQETPEEAPAKGVSNTSEEYRLSELLRYGFSQYQAHILLGIHGLNAADIRESYIKKGCSPEMIWRILRP